MKDTLHFLNGSHLKQDHGEMFFSENIFRNHNPSLLALPETAQTGRRPWQHQLTFF